MLIEKLFVSLLMVMSRKLILLLVSFSIVNLIVGSRLLNAVWTLFMSV
jgi:hypothetical protein